MRQKNAGFIKLLLIIIIAAVILGYYRVDLRNIIESTQVQDNLDYLWGLLQSFWDWISAKVLALGHNLAPTSPDLPE